ncbi:sex-determining region Y protein [Caerostris extrusa]|uniref:Sex-determining region Y protein n=1 Tax=Caerostris extrusa TaxID=172846 RepID=A0AAV4QCM7_CAEEX|nr:sex-determining region Y protein [Caerostris extrusa]
MNASHEISIRVKRPLNSYMLWSVEERKKIAAENPMLYSYQISKILGKKWKQLPEEKKLPFKTLATLVSQEHYRKYPNYKYRPRRKPKPYLKPTENAMKNPCCSQDSDATTFNHVPTTTYQNNQKYAINPEMKWNFQDRNLPYTNNNFELKSTSQLMDPAFPENNSIQDPSSLNYPIQYQPALQKDNLVSNCKSSVNSEDILPHISCLSQQKVSQSIYTRFLTDIIKSSKDDMMSFMTPETLKNYVKAKFFSRK